jgi:hypothetical protein
LQTSASPWSMSIHSRRASEGWSVKSNRTPRVGQEAARGSLAARTAYLDRRGFRRGAPGLSHSLLTQRLHRLERVGVIELRPKPHGRGVTYELTDAGRDLSGVLWALRDWGEKWLELGDEHTQHERGVADLRRPGERAVLAIGPHGLRCYAGQRPRVLLMLS